MHASWGPATTESYPSFHFRFLEVIQARLLLKNHRSHGWVRHYQKTKSRKESKQLYVRQCSVTKFDMNSQHFSIQEGEHHILIACFD